MKYFAYRWLLLLAGLVCGARFSFGSPVFEPIAGFRPTATSPGGSLFRHSNGSFYGLNGSILYRVSTAGELVTFPPIVSGLTLEARHLAEAADGSLWATRDIDEEGGGPNVFRIDLVREKPKTVSQLPVTPVSGLTSDGRGFLWGTTRRGGAADRGFIYKVEESTGTLTLMHSFVNALERRSSVREQRSYVREPLLLYGDYLWGTNTVGESPGAPAIFAIHSRTGAYKELGFADDDSRLLGTGPLSDDDAGNLWCTTIGGAVVKVNTATRTYSVAAEFGPPSNPLILVNPEPRRLVRDGTGNFWGTTARGSLGGGSIFKINIETGMMAVIVEFEGWGSFYSAASSLELGELINDGAGYLWATTKYGGTPRFPSLTNGPGAGSIFKVNTATGAITTVVDLQTLPLAAPSTALVADQAGNLWGTLRAENGVVYSGEIAGGAVFKINPGTSELTLIGFPSRNANDGPFPGAALVSARDGNLWGVATGDHERYGFIYKIDPTTWKMTSVVEFTGEFGLTAGAYPRGPLVPDPMGQLWGTAMAISGASQNEENSFIFKVDPATGQLVRVADLPKETFVLGNLVYDDIDSFWGTLPSQKLFRVNATTGELTLLETVNPSYYEDRLVSDGRGHLFGIHRANSKSDYDYIFKIHSRTGEVTKVFVFDGVAKFPKGLCSDQKGHLWGTVGIGPLGGAPPSRVPQPGLGAVFKLNVSTGEVAYLHNFSGLSYRWLGVESSPLVFDGAESFYGTISEAGKDNFPWLPKALRMESIFTFTRSQFSTLFAFTGVKGPVSGEFPASPRDQPTLVRHTDGNLYGSTYGGGVLPDGRRAGAGQFYRVRFGPTPVTLPAEQVNPTGATVHGTLNPNSATTAVSFEYGIDPQLATFWTVSSAELPPRSKPKEVSAQISDLEAGHTYYFRVAGRNAENSQLQRGAILSFTTSAAQ